MDELVASVETAKVDFPSDSSPTSADLHVVKHLSEADVPLDRVRMSLADHRGENIASYFYVEKQLYGVTGDAHATLRRTAARIAEDKVYRDSVSVNFVYAHALDWLQECLATRNNSLGSRTRFTEYLAPRVQAAVHEHELWFPIRVLRVDCEFTIGGVAFRRITKGMMDELGDATHAARTAEQRFAFNEQRSLYQGTAAACASVRAEPIKARHVALDLIEPAVGMLRLACPVIMSPYQWAPLHHDLFEHPHNATALRVENGRITGSKSGVHPNMLGRWLITPDELLLQSPRFWQAADALLRAEHNDFQTHLLRALLQYSKSVLTPDLSERLLYIISALESIFIVDSSEAIGLNLRERLAILQTGPAEERLAFMRMLSRVYEYRSAFVHRSVPTSDQQLLEEFFLRSCSIFRFLLNNHDKWRTKQDFITALEHHKFSAPIFTTRGMPAV